MVKKVHPRFAEWQAAVQKLSDAKEAVAAGTGGSVYVSLATMELNKITDEISDA
jgi:hypothetical protein